MKLACSSPVRVRLAAALALTTALAPMAASAAVITVNSTADEQIAGDGRCTIKEAFANVNAAAAALAVTDLSAGDCAAADGVRDVAATNVVVLAPAATYSIASAMANPVGGISDSAIVVRLLPTEPAPPVLVVEGRGSVLDIQPGSGALRGVRAMGEQHWRELTIRGGRIDGAGGGIFFVGGGDFTLEAVSLIGNQARSGGGLATLQFGGAEHVTLDRVTIAGNEANGGDAVGQIAGGLDFVRDSSGQIRLTIRNSTISGNRAQGLAVVGAGIATRIVGGIMLQAQRGDLVRIEDSTITGNVAVALGGTGDSAGGLLMHHPTAGSVSLSRNVISGNRGAAAADFLSVCPLDGQGPSFVSDGYNVLGEDGQLQTAFSARGACAAPRVIQLAPTDLVPPAGITVDRILGPLADNGGGTLTHALKPGSLAIDAIPANVAEQCIAGSRDQRGIARGLDGDGDGVANCDIGAYEANPPLLKLSASSLRFGAGLLRVGAVRVGKPSDPQVLTLRNAGGTVLNISGITTTGDFVQDSACGATLAPGASCTVTLRFLPSRPGERSGETVIDSDAPGGLQRVALSGRGAGLALLFFQ